MSKEVEKVEEVKDQKIETVQDKGGGVPAPDRVTALEKELKETKEKFLRTLADFDNYRKRAKQEQSEFAAFALEGFLQTLLPILDNFERAVASAEKTNVPEEFLKGIALIKRQLEDAFEKFGVQRIDALGKHFDPHVHEVVLKKKVEGKPDGEVIEIVQTGYTLHQKVIRPAMVIIAGE